MSEMDSNTIYYLVGLLIVLLVVTGLLLAYRRRTRDEISSEKAPSQVPPQLPSVEVPTPSEIGRGKVLEKIHAAAQPAARPEKAPVSEPAAAPGVVPAPEAPTVPAAAPAPAPHAAEEVPRKEPKALSTALEKTRSSFFGRLKNIFSRQDVLAVDELDEIEEILYTSDLGPQTVQRLMGAVEERLKSDGSTGFEAVRQALKTEMLEIFSTIENGQTGGGASAAATATTTEARPAAGVTAFERPLLDHVGEEYLEGLERLNIWSHKPAVIMVVGVNGAGKTTTIGKLARRIVQSGRQVLVAAGDTFRAAAGDQLKVWTDRAQVEIFAPPGVTDPSAVAFDACQTAQAKGYDVVIIDTAGRLHTQKNLMEELKKMKRVIDKVVPGAPHEILLVLDANSGQNALQQAREYHGALNVSGVVLTKLDGTAKGGVAVGLACEMHLPIKLIGVGEGIEDLRRFSSREFVDSII